MRAAAAAASAVAAAAAGVAAAEYLRWRRLREKIRTFLGVFRLFRTFSDVFERFQTFSDVFGRFGTFLDVFRPLAMLSVSYVYGLTVARSHSGGVRHQLRHPSHSALCHSANPELARAFQDPKH